MNGPGRIGVVDAEISHIAREAAEIVPHMVWSTRADGQLDYFNRRAIAYSGRTLEELVGWGWLEIVHPEDRERCMQAWIACLDSGDDYHIEYRLLRGSDRSWRWHVGRGAPMRDDGGRIVRWFGTCTDIDDRPVAARLETLLAQHTIEKKESEQRYRNLVELSADAILVRVDKVLVYANAASLRLLGLQSEGELVGRQFIDFVLPEYRELVLERARQLEHTRQALPPVELCLRRADGGLVWVESIAAPFVHEGRQAVHVILRDLTARRTTERALRDSERRFQLFMENLPGVAWIKDAQLRYTYLSENCVKALGRPREDFLGHEDFELWPAEAAAERRARDLEVQCSRQALQAVQSSTDPDGNLSHWLLVKFPFRDADGRVGVAGVGLDITERMQVQETLRHFAERNRQLQYRLLRAHESEQRRLAALLHDLIGQNLTILGLGIEFVRGQLPGNCAPQAAERLAQMGPLVESTISMVREVMVDMHPPVLDDYGLVSALRWYAQAFEARTGLRIRLGRGEPAARPAREIELALFRVVQEALTNAAKHGGAQSAGIEVSCDAACIRVTVTDDGAGMAERPRAAEIWRSGWGLPAMRERMEAVGGSLSIESSARGTCVTAQVPLQREAPPS